jgi:glycosyltransferase involved in cell wall biosynthesis
MNIALGAFLLSGNPSYRQAGVHRYAQAMLEHLPRVAHQHGHDIAAFVSPTALPNTQSTISLHPASRSTENPSQRILVEQIETPRLLRGAKFDLYHGLGFVAPLRSPCKTIVSVMDLSFVTQPRAHKIVNRTYLSLFTKWSCQRAVRVIAISELTKRDIVSHFKIDPHKIDVTLLGVDARFKPQPDDEVASFKHASEIGDHAIFYLGSLEPRKNLERLIEAFAIMTDDGRRMMNGGGQTTNDQAHRLSPVVHSQLIIGGALGWKYENVFARIKQFGLEEKVKLIGRVDDDDLPKWYSACAVFAYPSLYEGFGLPPLEAMACGAPIVASNVTSLPEVIGDAGILVVPTDTQSLANALLRVLQDDALRDAMRAKSLARAALFSWHRTAERTVESYERATLNRL